MFRLYTPRKCPPWKGHCLIHQPFFCSVLVCLECKKVKPIGLTFPPCCLSWGGGVLLIFVADYHSCITFLATFHQRLIISAGFLGHSTRSKSKATWPNFGPWKCWTKTRWSCWVSCLKWRDVGAILHSAPLNRRFIWDAFGVFFCSFPTEISHFQSQKCTSIWSVNNALMGPSFEVEYFRGTIPIWGNP